MRQTSDHTAVPASLSRERSAAGAGWTVEEISQQPGLWREVAHRLDGPTGEDLAAFLAPLLSLRGLRVVLTGAGTSAFAGGVLAPALARLLGRRVDAVPSTDIVSDPRGSFAEDVPTLLVSFARSGDSPESVATTQLADQMLQDCHHLVLTCNPEGRLAREHAGDPRSCVLLMPAAADDRAFAMTSSYSCMVLAALLALDQGATPERIEQLALAAEHVLTDAPARTRRVAEHGFTRFVYLGSGPLTALARESALKLLELTAGRVVTYYDSPLGFRHGPKSVLDDCTVVVVYVSNDRYTRRYDLDVVDELRAALPEGHVVAISAQLVEHASDGDADDGGTRVGAGRPLPDADGTWLVPGLEGVDDVWLSLPYVLHAQLLALQVSVRLGLTPDNPFPAGEVNRVVRGVTIHRLEDGPG